MTSIYASTTICAPVQKCFDLSLDINLELMAAAKFDLRAVNGVRNGKIGPGERVTWQTKQFGLRVTHTSEITGYDEPFFFEDSMIAGVFRSFRHEHFFEQRTPTQTIMKDVMTFSLPLLLGGVITERLIVRQRLEQLLSCRNFLIKQRGESRNMK